MAKIGLFGGSFNPIHNGHINLAESVQNALGLDKVVFIPSGKAPHKSSSEYVKACHRLEMCRLATEKNKKFEVSDFEINRTGKSYSIYTIRHFKSLYPNDDLYFLVGSDMLLCFDKWFEYKEILKNVTIAAVSRNGDDFEQLDNMAEKLREFGKIIIVNNNAIIVSSTNLRKLIKNNKDLSCYLNEKVVKYIILNKLYIGGETGVFY